MVKAKNISLKELLPFLKSAQKILIATHVNPDGDGLGSILALGAGLRQLKKKVVLYNQDHVPKMYQFLPEAHKITNRLSPTAKFDLSLIVDLGEIERVGEEFVNHPHRNTTISIDHHAKGDHNCDYNFCLPKQASSGEVVYKILQALGVKFNKAMATQIYTAMVTDTGSFKYSNTTRETFQIAADLAQYDIPFWTVALHCFETYSVARMNLLKQVMNHMEIHTTGKIAWIVVLQSDLKKAQASMEDMEGFINFPRSVETVEVALAFKEVSRQKFKVSLRSKNYLDVASVAAQFGGGGHIRAAGCTLEGSLTEVQKIILQALCPQLK